MNKYFSLLKMCLPSKSSNLSFLSQCFHYRTCAFALIFIFAASVSWANSVSLMNDTSYTLKATISDANGNLLGEFVLNPRDAAQWSDDYQNFGTESNYASQIPYTVNWACMSGTPFGSCNNVAAGSVVTAQSCGGDQECQQQQQQEQSPY